MTNAGNSIQAREATSDAMTRLMKETHASALRKHKAGFIDDATMREFDALCLAPLQADTPAEESR